MFISMYLVATEGAARDGDGARKGGKGAVDNGFGGVRLVSGVGDIAGGGAERESVLELYRTKQTGGGNWCCKLTCTEHRRGRP